jgi:hypothetical protein
MVPETFKVPVKWRVFEAEVNIKRAEPLVALVPVRNCTDPTGPAA